MTATSDELGQTTDPDGRRKWWILGAMGGVIGIVLLDETVVGVALPTIQRELGLSQSASHWVINAYMLVFAALAAAGGKLGDIFGHRRIFLAALALFGLASLACGFADGGTWLIAARAVQGIGAAIIFPLSMAMISIVFPVEQRGVALGIYGGIGTTLLALGPLVGGFLTDVVSWRWIFWINAPIVISISIIVLRYWRDPARSDAQARIDYRGLLLLVGGLFLFVFGIMQGPERGWADPVIVGSLAVGAALLVLFFIVELRISNPLLEVDLFRNLSFTTCNLAVFTAEFTKMAIIVFSAVYLQKALGMSPFFAGLALLAAVGPVPLLAIPSGVLTDRFGARRLVLTGLLLTGASLIWIAAVVNADSYVLMVPGLVVWGIGVTLLFAPPRTAVMNAVPTEKHGQVGGISMTSQLLGGTMGMAVGGTLLAMTDSFTVVFLVNAGVAFAILVLGWFYIERTAPRAHGQRQHSRH